MHVHRGMMHDSMQVVCMYRSGVHKRMIHAACGQVVHMYTCMSVDRGHVNRGVIHGMYAGSVHVHRGNDTWQCAGGIYVHRGMIHFSVQVVFMYRGE